MKIGLLIPSTSKGRDEWKDIKDTYLWYLTLNTFIETRDIGHDYIFYIGIDDDDRLYAPLENQKIIEDFLRVNDIKIRFLSMGGIPKGHLTKMWNRLFQVAYDDGCNYFFQCGDDISFKTRGWINACIETLSSCGDIGLTGPINNNSRILTQAMVSRKHMEIFGWFFPEQIINWCCDDWYNFVYQPDYFYPLREHYCSNDGGNPRYAIHNDPGFMSNLEIARRKVHLLRLSTHHLAKEHQHLITKYIEKSAVEDS
jgi:hypothetical protein